MHVHPHITPCLWFSGNAEEAANFYCSVFPNSRVIETSRYGGAGQDVHGMKPGSVMTVEFELDGARFTALNGPPMFHFTEAVSFQIHCDNQAEIDHYWSKLTADGGEESMCGWLKDKFGLSWQVVPAILPKLLMHSDPAKSKRAFEAMMAMRKLDIAAIERATAK